MYDNSRVPSYTNVSSRPCRTQYSRWSLDTPTAGTAISQPLLSPPSTVAHSSSFYFPPSQRAKQVLTPNYVNCHTRLPPSSSSQLFNYQHPKSAIYRDSKSTNESVFHVNDLRQRYDSKTIVGIVKPMVHQRSYNQLNNNNNNNNNESKLSEAMIGSHYHNSTHSLYPPPPLPSTSIVYRSRPPPSYNNINDQPPIAPRRHSSISNSKCLPSHRSSRTTSTSSTALVNEHSSLILSHENEQQQQQNDNKIIVDIKRLEMFYGSVGTLVKPAHSIALLYTTTSRQLANFEEWSCQQRGVPVWIYDTGANLKRARQMRLLLAQHESCFAVWSSLVSNQAELRLPKENFITCWLPESNLLAVLQFERDDACRLFFRQYDEILEHERCMNLTNLPTLPAEDKTLQQQQQTNTTTNHKEIPRRYSRLRTISTKQDKEQQQQFDLRRCRSLSKIRTVKKSSISGPINFEHVNHISNGCNQERPLSGTMTLRSLHASMSHLPSNGTLTDRFSKPNKKHVSTLFESQTTAV